MDSNDPDKTASKKLSKSFIALLVLSQIFGVASIILVVIWLAYFGDGFSWATPGTTLNSHPLFMVIGLVFLYGDAILLYRVFRNYRKMPIKIAHAVLQAAALILAIVGVKAVFDMHQRVKLPDLYSIHGWLGMITVVLFCVQWLLALFSFFIPQVPASFRRKLLPFHVIFGNFLFMLVIVDCVSGITEKNFFSKVYTLFLPAEQVGNAAALVIVLFGAAVFSIMHFAPYRRVEIESPESH